MDKKILHTVIDNHAIVTPNKLALKEFSGKQMSYIRLKEESDIIAKLLCHLDIGTGKVIGVFVPASIDYVVSILGVNKSGNIFMPLSPDYPENRLVNLVERVQPECYITNEENFKDLKRLLGTIEVPIVMINCIETNCIWHDENRNTIHTKVLTNISLPAVSANDGNYMIYTSGSTGEPKIITGKHKSLSHFIHWQMSEFNLGETDKLTLLAPVTFDVSLRDIFLPLVSGGTLTIPLTADMKDPAKLINWLTSERISILHIVPSLFRLISRYLDNHKEVVASVSNHLRLIFLAGEPLYYKDVMNWYGCVGKEIQLVNLYGPSETTLAKTFFKIQSDENATLTDIVPLGNPIFNTMILILNQEQEICQIGEVGEICVKTPFITKGYFDDEVLNNEKFKQNPLHNNYEDLIYFTGDLGKYLDDRSIAFIGRIDSQVKIRGNRVELGEVEKTIMGYDHIKQAIVMAIASETGDIILTSYFTTTEPIVTKQLINYMKGYLPDYMIPSFFIPIEDFPLNINGKINRKALPKPQELLYERMEYVKPQNKIEHDLAKIWSVVLNIKKVGVTNSFFELGGHSLNAVKAVSAIAKRFNKTITLKEFFKNDSIQEQALLLKDNITEEYLPIDILNKAETYVVSPSQKRLLILNQLSPNLTAYNLIGCWYLSNALDIDVFAKSIDSIVARHESLRTVFLTIDGNFRQRIVEKTNFKLELPGKKEYTKEELVIEVQKESAHYFELTKGPLGRARILRAKNKGFLFILNMHHIITDGWSTSVFVKELLENYRNFKEIGAVKISPLKVQYKEYAVWINQRLDSAKLEEQREYWHKKLSGIDNAVQTPIDVPRKAAKVFSGAVLDFNLDAKTSLGLKELAKRNGVSLFTVLQAIVNILLYTRSGNTKIVVGSPVAGRNHPDLENQIGMYLNYLVLLFDIKRSESFISSLTAVQQTILDGLNHQEYPFDRLVEDLKGSQEGVANPFYNVLVVMNNRGLNISEGDLTNLKEELAMETFEMEHKTSKLDLTFFIIESSEIKISLEYNSHVFFPTTIEKIKTLFNELSMTILNDPEILIDQLCWKFSNENKELALKEKIDQLSENF